MDLVSGDFVVCRWPGKGLDRELRWHCPGKGYGGTGQGVGVLFFRTIPRETLKAHALPVLEFSSLPPVLKSEGDAPCWGFMSQVRKGLSTDVSLQPDLDFLFPLIWLLFVCFALFLRDSGDITEAAQAESACDPCSPGSGWKPPFPAASCLPGAQAYTEHPPWLPKDSAPRRPHPIQAFVHSLPLHSTAIADRTRGRCHRPTQPLWERGFWSLPQNLSGESRKVEEISGWQKSVYVPGASSVWLWCSCPSCSHPVFPPRLPGFPVPAVCNMKPKLEVKCMS